MHSNNSPNKGPDPAVSFDPTFVNLLTEIISPEDLEVLDELLHVTPGAHLNARDGTGMLQAQTYQMASMGWSPVATSAQTLSPTQMSSQVR